MFEYIEPSNVTEFFALTVLLVVLITILHKTCRCRNTQQTHVLPTYIENTLPETDMPVAHVITHANPVHYVPATIK